MKEERLQEIDRILVGHRIALSEIKEFCEPTNQERLKKLHQKALAEVLEAGLEVEGAGMSPQ